MDTPSQTHKKIIKKAVTFNAGDKTLKKSRKSSSHKKKIKVKRESILKPSVYQKIQKKRKSQMLIDNNNILMNNNNKKRVSETLSKSPSICSSLSQTSSIITKPLDIAHNKQNKESLLTDNRRIVFISLRDFYNCWRLLPANILNDCILILPLYKDWIYDLSTLYSTYEYFDILSDLQFQILLQWKDKQGLSFYMLSHLNRKICIENAIKNQNNYNNLISPFWHNLSLKLQALYDPDTCDSYRPLLLNERWWKYAYINMYKSKYNVDVNQILNELHFLTMKYKCIQEILYQSNPSLNVIITYKNISSDNNNNNNITKSEMTALQCIKSILNEPLINNNNNNNLEEIIIPKIDIVSICEDDNYLSCDTLQSPSSSSSHIINKNTPINMDIMNSGSENDYLDDDLKINLNYNDKNESVSSSDIFANMAHNIMKNKTGKNKSINSSNSCSSDNDTLDDHEWWVCPDYYYDTYKNTSKNDTDQDADY